MSSTSEMWNAITRVGRLSHSITSGNNRMLKSVFQRKAALVGPQNASMRDSIMYRTEKAISERMNSTKNNMMDLDNSTGKVVDSSG